MWTRPPDWYLTNSMPFLALPLGNALHEEMEWHANIFVIGKSFRAIGLLSYSSTLFRFPSVSGAFVLDSELGLHIHHMRRMLSWLHSHLLIQAAIFLFFLLPVMTHNINCVKFNVFISHQPGFPANRWSTTLKHARAVGLRSAGETKQSIN